MLSLRNSLVSDADAINALHVRCWRESFRGKIDGQALDSIPVGEWLERRKAALTNEGRIRLLAEVDGRIAGFCDGGSPRDPHYGESGELYALYVDPALQGRGVGKALLFEMQRRLKAAGYSTMMVKTLAGNPPARKFYSGLGGQERAGSSFMFGGQPYPEVAYLYEL